MPKKAKELFGIHTGLSLLEILRYLLFCCVNSVIFAVYLKFTEPLEYLEALVILLCLHVSILSCAMFVTNIIKPVYLLTHNVLMAVGVLVGTVIGIFAAVYITGIHQLFEPQYFLRLFLGGILFGALFTFLFTFGSFLSDAFNAIEKEKLIQVNYEKRLLESNLRLLQSQIEPHFLFNTLSSIRSLLDTDPETGKMMLDDLSQYLRVSLSEIRSETTTIGREIKLVHAYIGIFKNRLKERLKYDIDIPEDLLDHPLPPMLLQPLVENAIIHGIEPKVEGGCISISAKTRQNNLRIEINDTGLGINENTDGGTGLSNIRERLESLYTDQGKLCFEENIPCGVKAIIEVPYVG